MNPSIFIQDSEQAFWTQAKEDVLLCIKETLNSYENCRIGLAGGSTPKALYEALAEEDLPWEKLIFIQIDERQVPSDHAQSNLGMLRRSLFNKVALPPENIVHFDTSLPPESAAKDLGRKLIEISHERFPIFDLLILGAGADGHIASLFEGDAALACTKYASPAHAAGYEVEERLTLCLMALKHADRALLLLKGEAKAPVLQALQGEADTPKLTALRELAEDMPVKVLAYLA